MNAVAVTRHAPPAPHAGDISQVRLSPDGTRLAFACTVDGYGGIFVAKVGSEFAEMLVPCESWTPAEIAWSPSGRQIAYRISGKPVGFRERVAWCSSSTPGEQGRTRAMCFAWAGNDALFVGDPDELELCKVDTATGQRAKLAHFGLHRSPAYWPRISPSPDGKFVVFTTRDEFEDTTRVWCIEWQNGEMDTRLITWIPGAEVHVHPFWTPKGKTLGLYIVHEERETTGLIALRGVQGDGQILYESDVIDGAITPAWSQQTDHIALFRADEPDGELALALLDCQSGETRRVPLTEPIQGELRFDSSGHLVIEGGAAVHLLDPASSEGAEGATS